MTTCNRGHDHRVCLFVAVAFALNTRLPPAKVNDSFPQEWISDAFEAIMKNYHILVKANMCDPPLFACAPMKSPKYYKDINAVFKVFNGVRSTITNPAKGVCWNWACKKENLFVSHLSVYAVFTELEDQNIQYIDGAQCFHKADPIYTKFEFDTEPVGADDVQILLQNFNSRNEE